MAFVVGAVVIGGVIIGGHDNHSRYSDHSRHREYGDSSLCNEISRKENEVNRKGTDVENLRRQMENDFNSRINGLRREKNYSGLDSAPSDIVRSVKADMRSELDAEISRDRQELVEIDKMIARINELELQAKR